ncbi:MAG: hypothetical protein ACYCZU_02115 [Devosia sp.]
MTKLSRLLFVIAILLLSLAGHGSAMAQGPRTHVPAMSAHAVAMHHGSDAHCDKELSCPTPGQLDSCGVIGHCPLGLVADGIAPLPAFRAARPVPAPGIAAFAAPQDNPERPPRRA